MQQDKWEAIKQGQEAGMAVNYSKVACLIYIYEVFCEEDSQKVENGLRCSGMRLSNKMFLLSNKGKRFE